MSKYHTWRRWGVVDGWIDGGHLKRLASMLDGDALSSASLTDHKPFRSDVSRIRGAECD